MESFQRALEDGADGVEFDVRLSRDNKLVVFHDARLHRLTGHRGFVRSRTVQELQALRILWNHDTEKDFRIPTLEETLRLLGNRAVLNIEIKGHPRKSDGVEQQLLELIAKYHTLEKTIISSFNPIPLRRLRKLSPEVATGFLIDRNFFIRRTEKALQRLASMNALHVEAGLMTPQFAERIHRLGLYCVVWGAWPPTRLQELLDLGVAAVITDYPDEFKKQLEQI